MDTKKALQVVSRQMPCPHETLDTRLGDGTTWARCEDCGATIAREDLPAIRKRAREFETALEKLRAECDAWLVLNFLERGRLHERLTALQEEDKRARAGLDRALAGLAAASPCAVRDGRCQSGGECQELGQCNPRVLRANVRGKLHP